MTATAALTFPLPDLAPLAGNELEAAYTWLDEAARVARSASCLRSSCGTVLVAGGHVVGEGANGFPTGCALAACRKEGGLPPGFKSDRTCCQHAEVRAILDAARRNPDQLPGSTLYFTRLDDNGSRQECGAPYCTICSKMAADVGVSRFVLEHAHGVVAYPAALYNELSFAAL